jgi:hypothetical protein
VFQTDGWGWNQTAFGYASFTKPWGKRAHSAETRFFALYYDDWRGVLKTDNRSAALRSTDTAGVKINTFDGHALHARPVASVNVDYRACCRKRDFRPVFRVAARFRSASGGLSTRSLRFTPDFNVDEKPAESRGENPYTRPGFRLGGLPLWPVPL